MKKLKVLYLAKFFEFKVDNGIKRRFVVSLEALSEISRSIDCVLLSKERIENSKREELEKFLRTYNVERVEIVTVPKYLSTLALLSSLSGRYYSTIYGSQHLANSVRSILSQSEESYDLIFYNYFYLTPLVEHLGLTNAKKVVDLVDAVSLHIDEAKQIPFVRKVFYTLVKGEVKNLEKKTLSFADKCFITTEYEKRWLLDNGSSHLDSKVVVAGNYVEEKLINCGRETHKKYEVGRNSISMAFIGDLGYYPNEQAVIRLVKIYRRFLSKLAKSKVSDVHLLIIGPNATPKIRRVVKANEKYSIELRGYVEDLAALSNEVDIFVLPMRIASGVQNKLLTALALGIPTVISKRARFSPDLVEGHNVLFADKDEEYIEKLLWCLENKMMLRNISLNANEFAQKHLSRGLIVEKFRTTILELFER